MTGPRTNGEEAIRGEGTPPTGGPTVRRAVVAAGELSPGAALRPRPSRARSGAEQPAEQSTEVISQVETSAPAATGTASESAGRGTDGPSVPDEATAAASGEDPPGDPDGPAGQGDEGPQEPSHRRAKYLLAVAGVGAVLLVVIPLLNGGSGSADGKRTTAAASAAEHTTTPPSPSSSLVRVPEDLTTASAVPTRHAPSTATRPAAVGHPLVTASHDVATSSPAAQAPKNGTAATKAAESEAPATTLVVKPVAKLVNGAPWKTSRLQLGMQKDGNLVLYDNGLKRVLWAAGTSGQNNVAFFQDDGNLVVYTPDGRPLWASNPAGFSNATLVLQSDGNVVIMAGTKQVWATKTHF